MTSRPPSTLSLKICRYGDSGPRNGLSVGVTHYLPRGVRRDEYISGGYFDVWLPLLSPSRERLKAIHEEQITFARFARQYRTEMRRPETRQAIRLLAAVAHSQPVHLGCFCADAARCHRSLLRELVVAAADELPPRLPSSGGYSSPACSMPEIED